MMFFFFSSRRRHTRWNCDWSSDVCSSDLEPVVGANDGLARVLDFGIAKAADRTHSTRDGQIKGKLSYMAPEQLSSGAVDRRSDVYSASVVLWEAITGQRMIPGESELKSMVTKVLSVEADPPSRHTP